MSINPEWKIELVTASDLRPVGLLNYAFSFTPVFNRPGSFSMTLPLDDLISYEIKKHSMGVLCTRNGLPKWSAEIVNISKDAEAMTMSFTALGWLDQLNHRYVRADQESTLTFVNQTGGVIAQALLAAANAQTDSNSTARPTALGFASASDTQLRTRSYKRGQNYGQALQELSDVENGFDIRVDPLARTLSTHAPTDYTDRTEVVFGCRTEPDNLSNVVENDDGSTTAQRLTVVNDNGVIVTADDPVAIDQQGGYMREDWLSLSNVSNTTIVAAYANAEVVYRRYGNKTYNLQIHPYADLPRLYDDFELGDKVYLSADAGALKLIKQAIRVFSVTLDVDANGNEIISQIVTAPQ